MALNSALSRRLLRNTGWLMALQLANYLFPLLLIPFLTRSLGVERYGQFAIGAFLAQFSTLISDYGFNLTAAADVAENVAFPTQLTKILYTTWAAKLLIFTICTIAIMPVIALIPAWHQIDDIIAIFFLMTAGNVMFPQWYFQGTEKMKFISFFNIGARGLALIGIAGFVHEPGDCFRAAFIYSLAYFISGAISGGVAACQVTGFYRPKWHDVVSALRSGFNIFVTNVAITSYTQLVTPILGIFSPSLVVGEFAMAYKVADVASRLVSPIANGSFPAVVQAAKQDQQQALVIIRHAGKIIMATGCGVSILLFFSSNMIFEFLASKHIGNGPELLRMLAVFPLCIAASTTLAVLTLIPLGLRREYRRAYVVASLVALGCGLPLVAFFHAYGAVATVLIAEAIGPVMMWLGLRRKGVSLVAKG